jgi:probable HAF family extracellular repeat protein
MNARHGLSIRRCAHRADGGTVRESCGPTRRLWAAARALACASLALLMAAASGAWATPQYRVIDLGTLGGTYSDVWGMNAAGHVVGSSYLYGNRSYHAYVWRDGTMIDLGTLGGEYSNALDINSSGQVAGWSHIATTDDRGYPLPHAFLWQNGVMIDLGTLGGSESQANAINEAGQVVGWSRDSAGNEHAFLWEKGVMRDLGTLGGKESWAVDINDAGQVAGTSLPSPNVTPNYHAFRWENGVITDLGALGAFWSVASGIDNAGHVVGNWWTRLSSESMQAFWSDGRQMRSLGPEGRGAFHPTAINARGQIVGYSEVKWWNPFDRTTRPFLYSDGVLVDLHDLLPTGSDWRLRYALDINDAGQIAGQGISAISGGDWHALLLTPILPDAPSVLGAQAASPSQIRLSWTDNSDEETGFEIERKSSGGAFTPIAQVAANTSQFEDGNLTPNTTFTYRIRAVEGDTVSPYSNEASAITPYAAPAPPADLTARAHSLTEVGLAWVDSDTGETHIEIERKSPEGDWTPLATVTAGETSFTDQILLPYGTYAYRVRARNSSGASDWSNESSVSAGAAAVLELSGSALDFGRVAVGAASTWNLTLTNRGMAPLQVHRIAIAGAQEFLSGPGGSASPIPPGASRRLTLSFRPSALGRRNAVLTIDYNGVGDSRPVTLAGEGTLPLGPDGKAARPVRVSLVIAAVDGVPARPGKITVSPGQEVTLKLEARYRSGVVLDVTALPETRFYASGARGRFVAATVWTPTSADAGRAIGLTGRYAGPAGRALVDQEVVHVRKAATRGATSGPTR